MDNETGRPEWAVVRTGLSGMRSTFVPLADAREVGDELQVPHRRLQVKEAPNIEPDGQLSEGEEAELAVQHRDWGAGGHRNGRRARDPGFWDRESRLGQ
jgi:hypothetical protein